MKITSLPALGFAPLEIGPGFALPKLETLPPAEGLGRVGGGDERSAPREGDLRSRGFLGGLPPAVRAPRVGDPSGQRPAGLPGALSRELRPRTDARPSPWSSGGAVEAAATAPVGPTKGPASPVLAAGQQIQKDDASGYAWRSSPKSPNPGLSGNTVPGETRPKWLNKQWKCNQFVGDALYKAGYKMPENTMKGGSKHYVGADQLHKFPRALKPVTRKEDIRPGDVFQLNERHTGLVKGYDPKTGKLSTLEAKVDGVKDDVYRTLKTAKWDATKQCWRSADGRAEWRIFRPVAKLPAAPAAA